MGRAKVNLRINSNDTIIDHTWIWRADHGQASAGPATSATTASSSTATTSLPTASSSSTTSSSRCCGTATTAAPTSTNPKFPTIRPTSQASPPRPAPNGWASYKVADNVTTHEAWGLGIY